jgi:hypothetical protein
VLAINLKHLIVVKLTVRCVLVVEASTRDSLLLVEYFQIRGQENSVLLDSSRTSEITVSSLNDFAIHLFLVEQPSELPQVFVNAKAADNHLGSQLNARDKFRLALTVCVSVLLL